MATPTRGGGYALQQQYIATAIQVLKNQLTEAAKIAMTHEHNRLAFEAWRVQVNGTEAYRRRIVAQEKRNINNSIKMMTNLSVKGLIDATAKAAGDDVGLAVGTIGRVYGKAIDQKWRQVQKINQKVADQAIEDMLRKYDAVHAKNTLPSYRVEDRFAGGRLRAALAAPAQAQATIDGVLFLNTTLLDDQARQWARLNFGAGPRAGDRTNGVPITASFFSAALGEEVPAFEVAIPYGPKGSFWIPMGHWQESGGRLQSPNAQRRGGDFFILGAAEPPRVEEKPKFQHSKGGLVKSSRARRGQLADDDDFDISAYTARKSALFTSSSNTYAERRSRASIKTTSTNAFRNQERQLTQGVAAWGFIEAGVRSLARNLPAANSAWLQQILKESQVEAGAGIGGKLNVDLSRINAAIEVLSKGETAFIGSLASSRSIGRIDLLNFARGLYQ